ncbi:MAG: class I SAM-dependent methyltransferase [Candidatus Woesearchaeota archaeon]
MTNNIKNMDSAWKIQYDKRAKLNIPDYKKSFWTEKGHIELIEITTALIEKIKNVKTIIDVGCGTGILCKKLSEKNYDIIGVDYSENLIELCKNKYPELNFIVANGYNLPFKDKQFDTAISVGVLQCLYDHERFIKELIRVSSKAVIISTLIKKKKSKNPLRTLKEQLKTDPYPCREYHLSEILPIFEKQKMKTSIITKFNGKKIELGCFIVAKY